jgi:hypothetical protein
MKITGSSNIKAILHSDGDLRQILDQLVSTGLDGYQSIDPQGFMDIAVVKRVYGDRLVLMGNVQASLLQEVDVPRIRQPGRVSDVLNRKRSLTNRMIRSLSAKLGISAEALIQEYPLVKSQPVRYPVNRSKSRAIHQVAEKKDLQ